MRIIALIALMMTALHFAYSSTSDAADLFNNIGQPILTDAGLNNATWAGLSFKTTSSNFVITAVNVPIKRLNDFTTGSIILSLYAANGSGSTPGTKLGSDLGSTPIAGFTKDVYENFSITGLNIALSPLTNYWLVTSSSGVTGNYGVGINNTGGGTVTGSLGFSDTLNSGGTWSGPTAGVFVIGSVTATVPEPSTCALGVIATGVMAITVRHRRVRRA